MLFPVIVFLRVLIGALLVAVLGVAIIPLLVLMDLNEGGDGMGLCPTTLDDCRTSYFDGFELLGILTAVLFILVGAIAVCVRLIRRQEGQPQKPSIFSGLR